MWEIKVWLNDVDSLFSECESTAQLSKTWMIGFAVLLLDWTVYSTILLAHCTSRSLTLPGTSGHPDRLCRKGEAGELLTRYDSLTSCEIEQIESTKVKTSRLVAVFECLWMMPLLHVSSFGRKEGTFKTLSWCALFLEQMFWIPRFPITKNYRWPWPSCPLCRTQRQLDWHGSCDVMEDHRGLMSGINWLVPAFEQPPGHP